MKLIIEEIVVAHPSGSNAGGYQRATRGVPEIDGEQHEEYVCTLPKPKRRSRK